MSNPFLPDEAHPAWRVEGIAAALLRASEAGAFACGPCPRCHAVEALREADRALGVMYQRISDATRPTVEQFRHHSSLAERVEAARVALRVAGVPV